MVPPLGKIGSGPERSRKHPSPAAVPDKVRYLRRYGKHIFTKSFTAFDPKQSFAGRETSAAH
jgi:hypothetical protein